MRRQQQWSNKQVARQKHELNKPIDDIHKNTYAPYVYTIQSVQLLKKKLLKKKTLKIQVRKTIGIANRLHTLQLVFIYF